MIFLKKLLLRAADRLSIPPDALTNIFHLELLGDRSAAPGIAAALGLESCRFRVPGPQTPYAMGKNLSGPPLPQEVYFGFSF